LVALTKLNEAPFSFYLRDKDKVKEIRHANNPELNKKFKANPIPG